MIIDKYLKDWIRGTGKWARIRRTSESRMEEYDFAKRYLPSSKRKGWSGKFGECLVESLLEQRGPVIPQPIPQGRLQGGIVQGYNKHRLDLQTEAAYIEVKTRNYTTSGTARTESRVPFGDGEKIFYAAMKYGDVYQITGKPVYVVLVGYQEQEAVHKFGFHDTIIRKLREFC